MTGNANRSVLQRKLGGGAASEGRSILRALRVAMARAAADLLDLPLSVIGARQTRSSQDDLVHHLDESRLLILLDGPDGGRGALALDRLALSALIQQQTMGRILGGAPSERLFTATDAALAAPLIDAMLTRTADLADQPEDRRCLEGFRFGARAEDLRSLLLALEAGRFRVFDLSLDFGGGQLQGALSLILPEPTAQQQDSVKTQPLGAAFGAVRAELTAVLCQLRIPLNALSDMKPGDVLPLPGGKLGQIEMTAINGEVAIAGRLGQLAGLRAVRLNDSAVPQPSESDGFAARAITARERTDSGAGADETALADHSQIDRAIAENEARFLAMSPDQVAEEISQLAGLSLEEEEARSTATL